MSLGGVRDEAEVRGPPPHLRGRAAGRILQSLRKRRYLATRSSCSTRSTRSGPTFAAIPPPPCSKCSTRSRTTAFSDHYIEVPFDLSKVLFIATANIADRSRCRPALRDRMEVIELPGYTERSRSRSPERYLVPRQVDAERPRRRSSSSSRRHASRDIIESYTREAGVRNLEREVGSSDAARCAAAQWRRTKHSSHRSRSSRTISAICWVPAAVRAAELAEQGGPSPAWPSGSGVDTAGGDILFIEATR